MPTAAPALDPTITDVLIPSAAILVSAAIAFVVIGIQLAAAKRERRSEAIGRVAASISHIIAEGSRKRLGGDVDFEPSMTSFDAAVIQLMLAVRWRDRVTIDVIRDRMYTEYVLPSPNMEVAGWQVRQELESWALGHVPNREFRALAAWSGHAPNPQRHLYQAWYDVRTRLADDPYIPPEDIARLDRRIHKYSVGMRARFDNWWQQMFFRLHRH